MGREDCSNALDRQEEETCEKGERLDVEKKCEVLSKSELVASDESETSRRWAGRWTYRGDGEQKGRVVGLDEERVDWSEDDGGEGRGDRDHW